MEGEGTLEMGRRGESRAGIDGVWVLVVVLGVVSESAMVVYETAKVVVLAGEPTAVQLREGGKQRRLRRHFLPLHPRWCTLGNMYIGDRGRPRNECDWL